MASSEQGSLWRKWDLHIHPPGTKLEDKYGKGDPEQRLDRYCEILEASDVAAFAITDYFSLDGYATVKEKYQALYPKSRKFLAPAVEFRLADKVNDDYVDFHVIFDPQVNIEKLASIVSMVPTVGKASNGTAVLCGDLRSKADFQQAMVSRGDLLKHLRQHLGEQSLGRDYITLCPVRSHGVTTRATKGKPRLLAEEVERDAQVLLGNDSDRLRFLDSRRYVSIREPARPKAVVTGSDAHSFSHLTDRLGKDLRDGPEHRNALWVKADPTFAGLLQILAEPADRVRVGGPRPDHKEDFHWIRRITFDSPATFPAKVDFNPNLTAIIGSRSSGKSALLAYVAHAVDPIATATRQEEAGLLSGDRDPGPGAGYTWDAVQDIARKVEWADSDMVGGKVIYIPQNYLYSFHNRTEEVTNLLERCLGRLDPGARKLLEQLGGTLEDHNRAIRKLIGQWWKAHQDVKDTSAAIREAGDSSAIAKSFTEVEKDLAKLRTASKMTKKEANTAATVHRTLASNAALREELEIEIEALSERLERDPKTGKSSQSVPVKIEIQTRPSTSSLPHSVREAVQRVIATATGNLETEILHILEIQLESSMRNLNDAKASDAKLTKNHDALLKRSTASESLAKMQKRHDDLAAAKKHATSLSDQLATASKTLQSHGQALKAAISARSQSLATAVSDFNSKPRELPRFSLTLEADFTSDRRVAMAEPFNKSSRSAYLQKGDGGIDLAKVRQDPATTLSDLASGALRLRSGRSPREESYALLLAVEDRLLSAEFDGDQIGGFNPSTMTPGKRALVALLLLLAQEDEPWPLLLDQPEDDLDSRSIFREIVPELVARKRERQIIMVSHDANLVIGADAECVVVSNRQGSDSPNRSKSEFDYYSGALEDSQPWSSTKKYVLERGGIREHACEVLDGGTDAFRKRRDKYALA